MIFRACLAAAPHNSTDRLSCQGKGDGAGVAVSAVWQRQAAGGEPVSFRLMIQSIWLDGAQRKPGLKHTLHSNDPSR